MLKSLFLALTLVLSISSCQRSEEVGLNPNDFAPSFKLATLTGAEVNLDQFKDKLVLINFFASWCVPCIEEMPSLQKLYQDLKPQGFELLAIAVDDQAEDVQVFVEKFNLTFPILLDKKSIVKNRYKVNGYPETFILKNGRLKMIFDAEKQMPVVRVIGPRNWNEAGLKKQLQDLLKD